MKAKSKLQKKLQPRIRVMCGKDIALGPGKADLLEEVSQCGSLAEAAARMKMSYMRAWTLLKTMERCFNEPLVQLTRGGAKHGGAELTETGRRVLTLYRGMEAGSLRATESSWEKLQKLMA